MQLCIAVTVGVFLEKMGQWEGAIHLGRHSIEAFRNYLSAFFPSFKSPFAFAGTAMVVHIVRHYLWLLLITLLEATRPSTIFIMVCPSMAENRQRC